MIDERQHMRQIFFNTWQKRENKKSSLSPLEQQILDVLKMHPEYHQLMNNPHTQEKEYSTDSNPFLHLSLHLGILEQLTTNRPQGIRDIYQTLFEKHHDEHHVQHIMMEAMGQVVWDAQQNGQLPNEQKYLNKLKKL